MNEQKLRSFNAQLFEGVTEKVVSSSGEHTQESEEQRGPLGSGRVLADIIRKSSNYSDHKFLDDYAYSLFEQRIWADDLVSEGYEPENARPFVSVSGRMLFGDNKRTRELLNSFNEIGLSFHLIEKLQGEMNSTKRMSKSEKISEAKNAAGKGLQFNEDYVEAISTLFEFGFSDTLEAKIAADGVLYSAPIKRESLRDSEVEVIQRYSRISEKTFTLVGSVTQAEEIESPVEFGASGAATLREQILGFANAMREIEDNFFGRAGNEIIVDPIAIYTSL
ncbi:hypothetical protein VM77_08795 [Citromicrobium sp. JL31]|nr:MULTISPECIES: hypothetical protein [Citromicrobium]ALG59458.1 hypothetical protein WG74_00195 [Citromicrobium sp. JL477]KPM16112.1 hypothetical protein VO58_06220 [Citromicrobium sp. JL1351]KPM19426.1 hypothetical protein VM77_08795 [Citromicrobium sp. JL31]KPM23752.1 hypothetical protein VO57_09400 [Citromicrobium sp. JL2201]